MLSTLRFLTCGAVDAGKSTLAARLLAERALVSEDLALSQPTHSSDGGLSVDEDHGSPFDIFYRSFATSRRGFVLADVPGEEGHTRNLAAATATSDVAVLVVDASEGLQLQTLRDARIAALLGIRHAVMAVNKMDLVAWDAAAFSRIVHEFQPLVDALGFESFQPIPVCALSGENISERSTAAPWYGGPALLTCLEEVEADREPAITRASNLTEQSDQFEAKVLCFSDQPLVAGRSYLFHLPASQAVATITAIKYQVDVLHGTHLAARALGGNEIGMVNISLDRPVPFEARGGRRSLGSFTLVDRLSNQAVAAGMIEFALRRAANIHWQAMDIDKAARAKQKQQMPVCLWFTGLSASGKTTIANLLEKRMFAMGLHTYTLDGDNIRHGLNRDLGFSEADRVENIRRVTEVARLLVDAGLVVIVSFISPYRGEREIARSRFEPGEFLEIFIDAPLEECERRDPKGLYAKARRGELVNFTGIDSRYEPPESPEVRLDTLAYSAEQCVDRILFSLDQRLLQDAMGTLGTS